MIKMKAVVGFAVLAVALSGLVSGCGYRDASKEYPDSPTFMREDDFMSCTNGHLISVTENTNFALGEDISLTVAGVRIEDGVMMATPDTVDLSGATRGVHASLVVGEAVTHAGVGTFTLLDVVPRTRPPGFDGGGGTATFCFEPDPDFVLDPRVS